MSKYVKWVTLTKEERQQVAPTFQSGTTADRNGQSCPVEYTRLNARAHRFVFLSPVSQRLWYEGRLENTAEAIQEKAQALTEEAFRLAQQEEQKEARRKTPPPGHRPVSSSSQPPMKPKVANALAGKYALCVQFASGHLLPITTAYDDPDRAGEELKQPYRQPLQHGQRFVIGLCCRWERRWKVAQCVVLPELPATPATPAPRTRKPRKQASAPPPATEEPS